MPHATKEPPTELAAWVRTVRQHAKLSQLAFAARVGRGRVAVNHWERGRHPPDTESIKLILQAFPAAPQPPLGSLSDPSAIMPPSADVNADEHGGILVTDPLIQAVVIALQQVPEGPERLRAVTRALVEIQNPQSAGREHTARTGRRS